MNRFPAVTIEYPQSGLIELTQQNGLDEPDFVELHPLHVRHIAQHMGLLRPDPDLMAVDTMRRQMLTLRDRIAELDDLLQSVMSFPPSSRMSEDCILSSELLTLIDDYIEGFENPRVTQMEPSGLHVRAAKEAHPLSGVFGLAPAPAAPPHQLRPAAGAPHKEASKQLNLEG